MLHQLLYLNWAHLWAILPQLRHQRQFPQAEWDLERHFLVHLVFYFPILDLMAFIMAFEALVLSKIMPLPQLPRPQVQPVEKGAGVRPRLEFHLGPPFL